MAPTLLKPQVKIEALNQILDHAPTNRLETLNSCFPNWGHPPDVNGLVARHAQQSYMNTHEAWLAIGCPVDVPVFLGGNNLLVISCTRNMP